DRPSFFDISEIAGKSHARVIGQPNLPSTQRLEPRNALEIWLVPARLRRRPVRARVHRSICSASVAGLVFDAERPRSPARQDVKLERRVPEGNGLTVADHQIAGEGHQFRARWLRATHLLVDRLPVLERRANPRTWRDLLDS